MPPWAAPSWRNCSGGNAKRRELLARYRAGFQGDPHWSMVFADALEYSSGHLMVALAPSQEARTLAVHALARIAHTIEHALSVHSGIQRLSWTFQRHLPLTHDFASRAITLPLHPGLRFEEVDEIVRLLRAVH